MKLELEGEMEGSRRQCVRPSPALKLLCAHRRRANNTSSRPPKIALQENSYHLAAPFNAFVGFF